MLDVSEREEGVMAIHLPIESSKKKNRYQDANPVPTKPLADDITIVQ